MLFNTHMICNTYEFIIVRLTIMNKFTITPYRKTIANYLHCKHLDIDIGYYKLIKVRTYTSAVHEILNDLFARAKIKDYSTDKRIYITVCICDPTNNRPIIDLSYVHYHSIGIDPLYTFEMNLNNRLIRHELYMDDIAK